MLVEPVVCDDEDSFFGTLHCSTPDVFAGREDSIVLSLSDLVGAGKDPREVEGGGLKFEHH